MSQSLKDKTVKSMIWNSVHSFGTMFISFAANLVLARLLSPNDFGMIGMLMVFLALADTLINGGFASALIQKKSPTEKDYSTVFYWNLAVSFILFFIFLFTAPSIARFYSMPLLSPILRVQSVVLIINGFNIIQTNQLVKQLNFKRLAKVNIIATLISSVIGIVMAIMGFGVWSLVAKMIILSFIQSLILWLGSNWRPLKVFCLQSFRELFRFGSFMLISSFVETLYTNVQSLIIGRMFSASDLGYYTQASKVSTIPVRGLSTVVNQVSFPVFSELQDNISHLKIGVSKNIKAITFLNFPLMMLFIVIAQPLFTLLFTSKWDESVPFFQILCVSGMLYTLNTVNTNIFKSLGKSNLYLFVQVIKRVFGLVIIIIGLQFGLMGMMWGISISQYAFYLINAFYSGRVINYGIISQIKDIGITYLIAVVAGIVTYIVTINLSIHFILLLIVQVALYVVMYLGVSYFAKLEGMYIYLEILNEQRSKR